MANGKRKKSKKKIIIFGGLGLLIIILILFALFGGSKEEIILVQTENVAKRDITQTVTATGTINPEFKVLITPEVTGEIISLPVEEGDVVQKGDLLIKIKGDQYQAQKDRLEANLKSAEATLKMREAELIRVKLEYERVKELHTKELASDSELELAESNYLSTKASYDAADANVLQSKAQLREVLETLYKTTIYSPMDGTITQLNVELSERVLGSGFSQGTNIMTVADLSNMEAVVEVDENDVVLISVGDTSNVSVDAFGDREFKGIVTQIGNSAQATGFGTQEQVVNFEVKIKLIDLDPNLRPGMSCNADIETETVHDVLSVPIQSVTARTDVPEKDTTKSEDDSNENNNGGEFKRNEPKEVVFLVSDGKAKMIVVETGISDDNFLEIQSGLEGDEEVVSGSYRAISRELKDGSIVRVERKDGKDRGNREETEN
ncbi:MAG: efflux RND transporter periplasmic adaptor subunit [Ignavibacteria bacterium]|nr:efflux RND transporter periplasmic adaptor subunit [Ignavibacteria bacterium]MBT8383691.1 efflux RND transporter periplasmic adaptor subunit [Ignavibacteria bacterium]NNJ52993.1 efflux RND transporter periplasmic adaptor subunit [Ignavibacteriaceae bacterium]NNL20005.1 efflux RND transporter periplasmic adaptor subunit [Ignavibacteriaceae bacterium]